MDIYDYLLLIGSLMLSLNFIPQVFKIIQRKTAKDISYLTLIITLFGVLCIISYGIKRRLLFMWMPLIIQLITTLFVLILKIYYCYYNINISESNISEIL